MPLPLLAAIASAGVCFIVVAAAAAISDWRDTIILWVPIGLAGLLLAAGAGLTIAGAFA